MAFRRQLKDMDGYTYMSIICVAMSVAISVQVRHVRSCPGDIRGSGDGNGINLGRYRGWDLEYNATWDKTTIPVLRACVATNQDTNNLRASVLLLPQSRDQPRLYPQPPDDPSSGGPGRSP